MATDKNFPHRRSSSTAIHACDLPDFATLYSRVQSLSTEETVEAAKPPGTKRLYLSNTIFWRKYTIALQEALSFLFSDLVRRAPDEETIHRGHAARNMDSRHFARPLRRRPKPPQGNARRSRLEGVLTQRVLPTEEA
jgi:hypothetical protein